MMPFNILHFEKFLPHKAIELSIAATSPGMAAFVISHGGEVRSLPRPKLIRTNPTTRTATAFIAFQQWRHFSFSDGPSQLASASQRFAQHTPSFNRLANHDFSTATAMPLRSPHHSIHTRGMQRSLS